MRKIILNEEQLNLLKYLYLEEKLSLAKIEKIMQIGQRTLSKILKENNIEVVNRQNMLNFDIEKDILPLYNQGVSLTKIALMFNTDRHTLSRGLNNLNIKVINRQNKTKFNENIFDVIDTEEKAYWLGFIFADGYISSSPLDVNKKSTYTFELSLSIVDIEHLYKFNKFMEHNKCNIKTSVSKQNDKIFERCRWQIANKHLWNTLNSYGCTPKKSLTLEFPNKDIFKSSDLIKHFVRGYFDGDGCISYHKTNPKDINSSYSANCSIVGTFNFLSTLKEQLECLNIPCENIHIDTRNPNVNILKLSVNSSKKLFKLLYKDSSIYLNRKYKRAIFFKENCRSAKELAELLQSENGEDCDVNTVLTSEITQGSEVVQSIEGE